ncbi:hypothetical protein N656DRAFT_769502 [Canariomyces notabilis]|uniref:Nuclear fusion protein KAR5 n=1 Tax=Canariomyces notabilis TaxID=2074819 RepID=A0AAN6YQ37_9PEZI|nr:hypothetical protein N656DRAFT_769502 [Canariomyces arenarius]
MQAHVLVLALLVSCINGFSWGGDKRAAEFVPVSKQNSRLSNVYASALSELQELESEPLCHRVAARLLVNNCQVLDGKDEATVLTDSGRQVRDFVDSYAASLAICDLERGGFAIPADCAKFREPALSLLVIRNEPRLHVSLKEIKQCLSALGTSDAAWSTWVSYRHKALGFCQAARADIEKDQHILLYQRLTKIIAKLTDSVEADLQKRLEELDNRARQSVEKLERLTPQVDHLSEGLAKVQKYLSSDLLSALGRSSESARNGLRLAENLQQLVNVMATNALDSNSQLAAAQEKSQQVSKKVNEEMEALLVVVSTAVSTAMVSSNMVQQQIEASNQQAALLAQRQDTLEQGMNRLLTTTEALSTKLEDHSSMLKQANNITNDILNGLEDTAKAASSLSGSLFTTVTSQSWWPFVVFPAASLVMGSYGLPPSIFRNLGLLALGEAIGVVVSSYHKISSHLFLSAAGVSLNSTASAL